MGNIMCSSFDPFENNNAPLEGPGEGPADSAVAAAAPVRGIDASVKDAPLRRASDAARGRCRAVSPDAAPTVSTSDLAQFVGSLGRASYAAALPEDDDDESLASSMDDSVASLLSASGDSGLVAQSLARRQRRQRARTYQRPSQPTPPQTPAGGAAPADGPAPRKRKDAASVCEALRRVLDGLFDVSVEARRCEARGAAAGDNAAAAKARTSLRLLVRAALAARVEVRRDLELVLLGDGSVSARARKAMLDALRRRLDSLHDGGSGARFSVAAARRDADRRDQRCVTFLRAQQVSDAAAVWRLEALGRFLPALRELERGWAFQKALLLDQLRLARDVPAAAGGASLPRHDRDALAYGTTPFSSICKVFAHPACAAARARCARDTGADACLVLGASSGALVAYAAALGLRAVGVEVVPTLVAVARRLACTFSPNLPLAEEDFVCADLRDSSDAALHPLFRSASIVVVTSTCWDVGLKRTVRAALAQHAAKGTIVVDYEPGLDGDANFRKEAVVHVPVSWCLDSALPIHLYSRL
ncbi:hypothetical protein M885DRAFT_624435 [Pelagophyceae sp. CCMP2097]|nr:hypothetical protein M885DRAFT_624435 [Pelagophyceae sp. CCMP2097]